MTESHFHLESAYHHFQHSIETLTMDLSAMHFLPIIFYEFARMLELFGSFEASLELYSRILTNFPMYRGYFDAFYRSAILGIYIFYNSIYKFIFIYIIIII